MIPVSEISRRLAERAEAVCKNLVAGGEIVKNEYVCAGIRGGEGKSLKVHLSGSYAGHWKDWATDDHGDLLDLWMASRSLSPGEAVKQAKEWLGIHDPAATAASRKSYALPPPKPDAPPHPGGQAFKFLTDTRKLSPETLTAFKVATQSGDNPAIVFPCYSPTGQLLNRSYRTIPKVGKKRVWQDTDCAPCMFGWHALPQSAIQSRTVLLAEGQIDAMTWHQWGIPALSIPAGSGQTWIDHEWDNLALFDKILVAFDMDGPGREMAQRAIKRLGAHRCFVVTIPHKDANDALQAGCTAADAAKWIAEARVPAVPGLVIALDLVKRLLSELAPKPQAFTLKFFALSWPATGLYFRPAEVTLWTGVSHHGKSAFLNFLALSALVAEAPVFVASMEVKVETTLRKMASAALAAGGHALTNESAVSFISEYGHHLVFADVVGFITQDRLFEMMRFSFQCFGVEHFIIDSLMRVQGLEEDYPAQGEFMNRLQEFTKDTGAHVHLVAHPRKLAPGGKPAAMDVKGSSLIPNNADNIVAVVRNMEKAEIMRERALTPLEAAEYDTEIRVEKQRETGWLGSYLLRFNSRDYTFSLCPRRITDKPEKATKKIREPHSGD